MADMIEVTDGNFESEVLGSDQPFLLDFTAEWCGPCKALKPVLKDLADEYKGRVKFGAVDIDSNQQTAMTHHVRSIPTLLLFKDGKVVGQMMGAQPKGKLVELLGKAE